MTQWPRSRIYVQTSNVHYPISRRTADDLMALCTSPRCRSFHIDLNHEIAVIYESDSESHSECDDQSADESVPNEVEVQPTAKKLSILGTLMSTRSSDDAPPDALIRQGMSNSESDDESDDENADESAQQASDDVQSTAKQLPIVATPTSAHPSEDDLPALRLLTTLALEEPPVVSTWRSASDERPAVVATVVPLAPSATPEARSVSGREAHRTVAPPPFADNSNQPRELLCTAAPPSSGASVPLTQSTTRPASASGGGADGARHAAAMAPSPPAAELAAVAAAALERAQLHVSHRRLEDEVNRRAELEARACALVDEQPGVTHVATVATARLAGAAHCAEREGYRRCRTAPFDERPDPKCDGARRRAAPSVDAAPSDSNAAPSPTAPSPKHLFSVFFFVHGAFCA